MQLLKIIKTISKAMIKNDTYIISGRHPPGCFSNAKNGK
nr:MAG TPA: hypothetical protein [Caudoviricetes sp.]